MFDDIDLKKVDSIEYVNRLIGESWKVNIKMLDGTTYERYADCNQNIMIDWKSKLEQIELENENKKSGSLPL
tara:strand:- start:866 stop:1081 length:216 start_codon:yes stop_codon:yes gene_type:complete